MRGVARVDDLDWDDLRYFLRAAQSGTLAGAARAARVEHTTIGRRISALEKAFGASLVLRKPDGLQLTPLGTRVKPLVEEVERIIDTIRALAESENSRVRLAVPSGFTELFTRDLGRLRREHPDLTLEILSGSRPVDLLSGEADLAIRSGPLGGDELIARKVGEVGWALYGAESYLARKAAPIDPDDLTGHELVGYDPSLAAAPAAQWIDARAANATLVLRSREMTEMLAATVSGTGLAVLPCMLGELGPNLTRLSPVLGRRDLMLVYRREAKRAEPVRAVIAFVIQVLQDSAERIRGPRSDAAP